LVTTLEDKMVVNILSARSGNIPRFLFWDDEKEVKYELRRVSVGAGWTQNPPSKFHVQYITQMASARAYALF
jgi:hypothetical protein